MPDEQTPDEEDEARARRTRASAQSAASDLARMGIDPRALGLDAAAGAPPSGRSSGPPAGSPAVAAPVDQTNVVPLRPEDATLPESGTSMAWQPAPPTLAASETSAGRDVPVERLLAGSPGPGEARPSALRLARAVTFGVLTPDAADAAEREREMVARVRSRQTEHRVVVFVSAKGGVGTTTVAAGVGCVLSALRDDRTTLASTRPGTPSLGLALGGRRAPTARDLSRSDVEADPAVLGNGLLVVDGPAWSTPLRRTDVPALVDRLAGMSTFVLFDVGNDPGEASASILSRADQVVVVTGAGADGAEAARVAADRVADADPYLLDSAVYAVVCQREAQFKGVVRRMRETMPQGARIVAVPADERLAQGHPFDPSTVAARTRMAMIDIAGLVALGSIGTVGALP
jgi:MinD-like ATPase involved in chromosome partitioning or flagellar assembly